MRARGAVAAIAWAVLALPASSYGATFYAADSNTGTATCLTPANACTIVTARGLIDNDPSADVLNLAAGNYTGAEDLLAVDGLDYSGLVVQGAGRDQTTLNQFATNQTPFSFGGLSDDQTVRDLTFAAAAASTANSTVGHTIGSLTLENVDVLGPPNAISHRVIGVGSGNPNLTLNGVRVFHAPTTAVPSGGGNAVGYSSGAGSDPGQLTIENSSLDVLSGPSRAVGLSISGEGTAVMRGSVVRMRTTGPIASSGPTDYGEAISFIGAPSPANPSLAISDSAVTGGKTAIDIRPHPNNNTDDYRATASVVRTSIDAGAIGVSENPGVSPFIRDVIGAS